MAETKSLAKEAEVSDAPDFPGNESEYNLMNLKAAGIKICTRCNGRTQTDLDGSMFCAAYTSERQHLCPMLQVS